MKSGARSEYVVDQQQVLRDFDAIDNASSHPESPVDVGCFAFDGELRLGAGAAAALEDVYAQFCAEDGGDFACNNLGLIVTAGPFAGPMQGHGDDSVYVCEVLCGSNRMT